MGERPGTAPAVLRASFFASLRRYDYLGTLGHGGTGYVFKAIDRELNEVIAIKVMVGLAATVLGCLEKKPEDRSL